MEALISLLRMQISRLNKSFLLILLLTSFISLSSCAAEDIRKAAVSGKFYSSDPKVLAGTVSEYLKNADPKEPTGSIKALVVPHAGYPYSGAVAAYSFKLLENRDYKTYILIGLSHGYPLSGASVYAKGSFETPLGLVKINSSLAQKLIDSSELIKSIPEAHKKEHSLEVELPFLQILDSDFDIVPILLGNPPLETCKEIGNTITSILHERDDVLLICSTDMSHYPRWKIANEIDNIAIQALKKFDPVVLFKKIKNLEAAGIPNLSCVFCSEGALYTTMYAARGIGADNVTILKYANSGDTAGSKSSVVGYLAAVFSDTSEKKRKNPNRKESSIMENEPFKISEKNQGILLEAARESIELKLANKKIKKTDPKWDAELKALSAVFVTLNKKGSLRGCIGTVEPSLPLIDAVSQMAASAAFNDHRFPPVSENELESLHIEISVLSPIKKISGPDEIKEGAHGVIVRKGARSGLFLPQVWEHFSNNKEEFMGELCHQKAGLDRNAWKTDQVELYTFTVFSFEE